MIQTILNTFVIFFIMRPRLKWHLRYMRWHVWAIYGSSIWYMHYDVVCLLGCALTHRDRDKIAAIFQTTFPNAFSWMKLCEFWLRFHWSLFLRVQLTIFRHWFKWLLGAGQATSHYLDQWWLDYRRIYASPGLNELKRHERTDFLSVTIIW